ncbi:low-density lipoprotein receptor-related protein 5-like [Pomacea canaliculata]|uniref:low-density lipoprotein receptor-related protein 5-like n=1 Tax=Pomacea canaliculata TaxID=400727 RepID=UPI000D736F56|nr:low-density lipoprotein receptor-related protein 5-like [Pomacea canaliculata]XP_025082126.1 low-density lipoprotein receptor-related protein 5-like [Pomacea canaliculata]XP_025082127.1 low-density lipoprotein receptor-related protein 5-like [Pomacea canaliculata]
MVCTPHPVAPSRPRCTPVSTPPDEDCTYIISTTQGHRITLTFVTFEIEAGTDDCELDFLQIRDGSSRHSPSMGIFCNTSVPDRVRSTSNTMWIRFQSGSQSGTGFNATYSSAIIPQKFLLVTDYHNGIRRIDIDTGSNVTIRPSGLQDPLGIDYDPVDGRVYWSNQLEKTIRSANLDGSDAQLVRNFSQGGRLLGLSVDSVSRLLFYGDDGNKVIGMISLDNNSHQIVIDSDIGQPLDIELDKHNGVLYWSDPVRSKIERCNYNGSHREAIISTSLYLLNPTGLALDTEGRRLYWADAGAQLIGWMGLDDRRPEVLFRLRDSFFIGLDIYQNELFVTDWGPKKGLSKTTHIYRIGENSTMRTAVQVNGIVNDVRVYAEESISKASTSPTPTSKETIKMEDTGSIECFSFLLLQSIVIRSDVLICLAQKMSLWM